MEDVDFGKPSFTSHGDTLTATVPVTDSWGEAAPDLSGKTLSLVLADNGQKAISPSPPAVPRRGWR